MVVEDPISAARASAYVAAGVSLNGVLLNDARVQNVMAGADALGVDVVRIMLDADATALALGYVARFRYARTRLELSPLRGPDLKDLSPDALASCVLL